MLERRGLGVGVARLLTGVGVLKDVQSLADRRHHSVLDPVVDHLHEVARTGGAAVEVALLGRGRVTGEPGSPLGRIDAGGERSEDRLEPLVGLLRTTDHQAVATLEAEHSPAGATVEVVDPGLAQPGGDLDVIAVIGVAAVDDHIAGVEPLGDRLDRLPGYLPGRDHYPDCPGRGEHRGHCGQVGGRFGPLAP